MTHGPDKFSSTKLPLKQNLLYLLTAQKQEFQTNNLRGTKQSRHPIKQIGLILL